MANWQAILDKCARLANDAGATPSEREAALNKMTQIMDTYKLEISRTKNIANAIGLEYVIKGEWAQKRMIMAHILSKLFDVTVIDMGGGKATFVGTDFSVTTFVTIFEVVMSQLNADKKAAKLVGHSGHSSFMAGYAIGLKENVDCVHAERNKNTEVMALVVTQKAENDAFVRENIGKTRLVATKTQIRDAQAKDIGIEAGKRATVDRTLE